MKFIGHPASFVTLYLLLMVPTYILPWMGSNSAMLTASVGVLNWAFWFHLLCIIGLIALCWVRGTLIDRKWLIVFPILAGFFDLTPGLNWIPGIPTLLHVVVIILGVALSKNVQTQTASA